MPKEAIFKDADALYCCLMLLIYRKINAWK